VGAVAIAFGASVFGGIAAGLIGVTRLAATGFRPRPFIREHREAFSAVAVCVTAFAVVFAVAAVIGADALRLSLGLSCGAAGALFGAATWLLAVEPDDDSDVESSPEPSWWPDFERDLYEWDRARRTPTLSRR
jgi:hypothetical protein